MEREVFHPKFCSCGINKTHSIILDDMVPQLSSTQHRRSAKAKLRVPDHQPLASFLTPEGSQHFFLTPLAWCKPQQQFRPCCNKRKVDKIFMIYEQILSCGVCRPMINGTSMFSSCIYSEDIIENMLQPSHCFCALWPALSSLDIDYDAKTFWRTHFLILLRRPNFFLHTLYIRAPL